MTIGNTEQTFQGTVIRKTSGQLGVQFDGQTIACTFSSRFMKQGNDRRPRQAGKAQASPDPVAVGDEVRFVSGANGMGQIVAVLPRRSQLSRRSAVAMPGAHAFEQVLVANVDQVVPVFAAANPTPHWNMLDRYLVTAEAYHLPALICITKLDLVSAADCAARDELEHALAEYRRIGYSVITVSSLIGSGLNELKQALHGRISVLLGKSGVGKTSLLNAIQPGLGLRVNAVNQVTGKGKHTTTCQEMFPLAAGGAIVDTPGEREFGLWNLEPEEIAMAFPEIRPYLGRCRFGLDCRHVEEPGCAVRKAVMDGGIIPRRYQSYLRLCEG